MGNSEHQIKVFVEGHGCSASFADTEIISGMVQDQGYRLVEDENQADVAVLVTCSVKTVTEQRMISRIRISLAVLENLSWRGAFQKLIPPRFWLLGKVSAWLVRIISTT